MAEDNSKTGHDPIDQMEPYIIKDMDSFAMNLARMVEAAGQAASAWIAPRENGPLREVQVEPMMDVAKTLSTVTEYWMSDPKRTIDAQAQLFSQFMGIWSNSLQRLSDNSIEDVAKPDRGDKRFNDEDWTKNAFFDFLKQAYLVTSRWAADLVTQTEGLDDHTRHKAAFYVQLATNAFSPSNFV